MNGDVIKSFLVGLGFGVDEASLARFNKAIVSATARVGALYAGIKVAAAGIFWGISRISEGFEQMGYEYRIIAPAINKALLLRQALLSAYRAAGVNITRAVQQSVLFNFSLAKTKFALEAIYKSVGLKFLPLLTKQMDIFRTKIYANLPKIKSVLEGFVAFVFKAFEATTILGSRVWSILERVWDLFKKLDDATGGWSTKIIGAIAAWNLLNLSFLKTPLGLIIAGLLTILALFDDFKTWQEGGQSLIDWGNNFNRVLAITVGIIASIPIILGAASFAMRAWAGAVSFAEGVMVAFNAVMSAYRYIMIAVNLAMLANPVGVMIAAFLALAGVVALVYLKWDTLKRWFGEFFDWASEKLANFSNGIASVFGKANPNFSGTFVNPNPLYPQPSGVNQRVSQETNIIVQGSADATAVGKSVAGEQSRVNYDMSRNLKSPTK